MGINIKKYSLIFGIVALVGFGGCGDDDNDSYSSTSDDLGVGYYLDSAVEGVDYICGSQSGTTDVNGKFLFEQDKNCTFKVADINLRTIDSTELFNDIQIVEDNITVAAFLQTIDADGNASNGITIKEEFKDTIQDMIDSGELNTSIDSVNLSTLQSELKVRNSDSYNGVLVSESEALSHINSIQQDILKGLMADKTLYSVGIFGDKEAISEVNLSFNSDLTKMILSSSSYTKEKNIKIKGNKLLFLDDTNGDYTVVTPKDNYILFENYDSNGFKNSLDIRGYFQKLDADSYLDSIKNDTDTLSVIIGKELYKQCVNDDSLNIILFDSDGKFIVSDPDEDGNFTMDYSIIDRYTISLSDEEGEDKIIVTDINNKYVEFDNREKYYFNKIDAQNNPTSNCNEEDDEILMNNILTGKITFKDENNNTISAPSDAWIRLTPLQYQEEGSWNRLRCKVNSDGSFGDECYIYNENDDIEEVFRDSNTLYQVVIFKNNIDSDDKSWDCGEDLYKYVGDNLTIADLQNIIVLPEDYQDRSSDECSDDDD